MKYVYKSLSKNGSVAPCGRPGRAQDPELRSFWLCFKSAILCAIVLALTLLTACQGIDNEQIALATPPATEPPATPTAAEIAQRPTATPISAQPPTPTQTATATVIPTATSTPTPSPTPTPRLRRLTTGDCCTEAFWSSDTEIRFIDKDPTTGQTGFWSLDVTQPEPQPVFVTDRLGTTSPTGRYFAYPDRSTGLAVIEAIETGESWTLDLNERPVNFAPDGEHLLWIDTDPDLPFEEQVLDYWLLAVDGSDGRHIATLRRTSALTWLDENTLLVSMLKNEVGDSRFAIQRSTLARFSLIDGAITELFEAQRPRDIALNPSQTALVYYSALNQEPADNGMFYVDLEAGTPTPQLLPWIGSYQWQDDDTLIYIPFDPAAESHLFYAYDLSTGESRPLTTAAQTPLVIANNDWSVSPDGSKIVLLAAQGFELAGLWLVELTP